MRHLQDYVVILLHLIIFLTAHVDGRNPGKARTKQPYVQSAFPDHSNEYKVKRKLGLLRTPTLYDKTTRPVKKDSDPVNVNVAISLYHILDTNEKEQTFTTLLAIRQLWKDEYLVWDPAEFGGVSSIRVPADKIWTPDLVISNFAGDKFNDFMITNTIVSSDGSVLWLYPALIKTYCTLNVKYFPFDTQKCKITFISWTHSSDQLDVLHNNSFNNSIYYKSHNQEWAVDEITAERREQFYACCVEPYPDVTFTIHMRRGSLFYIVNLIAPCFLIFLISFMGFFLPVESGEKVNLETTILLALVVFLLMVGETMPPTPDAIPILGMYFGSTMLMVTIALVMCVTVTNIYAKKDSPERCPPWVVNFVAKFYSKAYLPQVPPSSSHRSRKHSPANGKHGDIVSITDGEIESLTCACCSHCAGGSSASDACRYVPPPHIHHSTPPFDYSASEAEWKLVAKFADRMFFWLFVAISTTVQVLIFTQMVPT